MSPKLTFLLLSFQALFLHSNGQPLPKTKTNFLVLRSFDSTFGMNAQSVTKAFTSLYLTPVDQNGNYVRVDIYSDSSAAIKSGGDVYKEQFRVNGSAKDSAFYAIMAEWHIESPSKEEAFLRSRNDLFNLRKQYINSFSSDILLKNLSHPGRFLIIGFYSSEEGLRLSRSHPEIQTWIEQVQSYNFSARNLYAPRIYKISESKTASPKNTLSVIDERQQRR